MNAPDLDDSPFFHRAPVLLPAAALAAGAALAFRLTWMSLPLLVALAVLGLTWRRRAGFCLTAFAAGALAAALAHDLPGRPLAGLDRGRPVEVSGRVSGHWTADEEGWSAPLAVRSIRQGDAVLTPRLEVLVYLPGEEAPPPFGTRLRARGYLARSAGFANRVPSPPGPWRLRVKSRVLMEVEEGPGWLARLSGRLRARVETAATQAGSGGPGTALARAFVLGDASDLPEVWRRGLRVTGLSHLLSVSGVHVALVAGAVLLLGSWLPRTARLLLAAAAIALYLMLVGPLPALVRAAVMGLLAVAALLAERPPASANALGWAVILLVVARPETVLQPSFQLSVAATAGLLLLGPPLAARWTLLPGWLGRALATTVAAQIATMPWALPLFYLLTPASPLANLLALPWAGAALVACLGWTGLAVAWPAAAAWILPALNLLALPLGLPGEAGWTVHLGLPLLASAPVAMLAAVGIAVLLLRARPRVLGALLLLSVFVWVGWKVGWPERGAEIILLDVGQGDAILLRDGPRAVLVDGGGWRRGDLGGRVLLPALLGEGIRSLDALVLTHPDRDHCSGLVDLSAYLVVREVWMSPGWDPQSCAGKLLALPGPRHRFLSRGDAARVGRWRLTVLHPERGETRGDENERSLVLRAEVHGRSALLTGDLGAWGERRLLDLPPRLVRCDLLKVAHHGSRSSSTEDFLEVAAPRLALISAGPGNMFRHPTPEVLERLADRQTRILRTDRDGLLRVMIREDGALRFDLPGSPR